MNIALLYLIPKLTKKSRFLTGAPGAQPDFLFYRKSRFDIIVALRGDTPPSAGVVIGLLVYCAIVALRGDTPPTAGIPNNSTPHPSHPPWGYAAFGGVGYWAIRVLCYSGSAWGYAAYGGHP